MVVMTVGVAVGGGATKIFLNGTSAAENIHFFHIQLDKDVITYISKHFQLVALDFLLLLLLAQARAEFAVQKITF